ncbi:MAG: ABC transporter substrate-binding protein [Desulfobacterales bacterium]|jgi:microcin C transport system substrate-binding protein|nr:ABC transporter substrate-binding protein [Desulfobacteraceae bacterium]MBT4363115.1 ABC transporter substrate-binding protein [Desulfobacteraceae bacterium]MBT7085038.1 ABC transporter substrate-binding protein [Desulfobacterales bacterium]MBT7696767.1 ABC transporter substrate-binding protein [Desulfobacterales bacterium]
MGKKSGVYAAIVIFSFFIFGLMEIKCAAMGLPKNLKWLTNNSDPVFSSTEAKKGGTFHSSIMSFPLTFRTVGPDSNSSFRSAILDNQLSLINIHPNTESIIPEIATHWAYGDDKKTMYFKLDKQAKWSDGKPVSSHDFAYTLEFMRSKFIVAPWYNDYYTKEIEKVIVYDDHTLAVVATKAQPDLHLRVGINPTPEHYYGKLDKKFVRKYNWKIAPNTGPYQVYDFKKGKYIKFKRKRNWWAKDHRYSKNRFNVNTVIYKVIRDSNVLWEYFKKGKIDAFVITIPKYWHVKTKTPVVENGYVHKIWFFNDTQQSAQGMWLNQDRAIFKDKEVRYAFAHSMNIQKVIKKVLRNDYYRLEHGFMGYGSYSNNSIHARRFDLEKVKNYLKNENWKRGGDGIWEKNGKRFSVEVSYHFDEHTKRLVVLKEEAKKAGIELRLQRLDPAAAYKKVLEKRHDVAWSGWSTSLRPQYWEHFHSTNAHKPQTNNITNTDDPEMDKLIEAYRSSLEEDERIAVSLKIQEKIHDIGMYVPTFMVPYVRHAYWRWWKLPAASGTKISGNLFDPFGSTTGGLFWYDKHVHETTKAAVKRKEKLKPVTIIDKTYKMENI